MSAELPIPEHLQADPGVLTRLLDGEAVLFDSRTGTVIHLNPSASAVWLLLDGTRPLGGVATELADIFGVPLEVILPDVEAAVADFKGRGLLVRDDPPEEQAEPSPLLGLSVLPRPPERHTGANPFSAWNGQVNLRAGDFVVGVEYDSPDTARMLRAAAGELFTSASDLQDLADVPAAFGVRTAASGSQDGRIGIVHHGADVRYRRGSLDEAVDTLLQALEDLSTLQPGATVAPFHVYARDRAAVMVDTLSGAEVDHERLGRDGITEVPCCAPTVDPCTGQVQAGGGTYRLTGIVEPRITLDAPLDEVRRTVTSRVAGDQHAFAILVDGLGERVMTASTAPGNRDVTAAVARLLARRGWRPGGDGRTTGRGVAEPSLAMPRLGEAVRIGPFAAGGQPFVIDCNDAEFAAEIAAQLPDLRAAARPAAERGGEHQTGFLVVRREPAWLSHPWAVWRDGEPCELTVSDEYVRPYIVWEITRLVIEGAHPLIPVHAAAVARDGRALVLAGPSHSGKSTLAGWLTAHGWEFLTDEVALLERRPGGTVVVHPFWRPIGVRRPGPLDEYVEAPAGRAEVLVPASRLGRLGTVAPLAAIVFPRYEPGSQPAIEPRSRAVAVRELAAQLPTLGSLGEVVFDGIVGISGAVPSFSLPVDDLAAAAAVLEPLVRRG